MKRILRLIFNRWTLAIIGLIALALLIWWVGPMFAFNEWHPLERESVRWSLIGLMVAVYVARQLWRIWRARRSNASLIDGMLKQPASPQRDQDTAAAQEMATLRKRFEEAMSVLKKARLGAPGKTSAAGLIAMLSPRQYVYQLPWYVFIGPPGSGKTTALVNAGLQFPLAERFGEKAVRGVGGTRDCDWWFTDEAVLIDTAGRYTTQDSNLEVDSAAWSGFLQLLKKFRPRRPLNGAIVAINADELVGTDRAQREAHAAAIRQRIQELYSGLGVRFPIYLVVTKADLLAGFMEFFGDLGKEERAQVWGFTFPAPEDGAAGPPPLSSLSNELVALESRLNARLVDRMQQERDLARRALIYGFPQQFSVLREPLLDLVDKVFSATRFDETALLRGVYFTSGTQEGSPLDRVLGGLGRSLGLETRALLPAQRASGKSFFLTRLLKDVIFREANLAGTDRRWERRRALAHAATLGLAALASAGLIAAWWVSYANNKAYVAEVAERVAPIAKEVQSVNATQSDNLAGLLPVLRSVRELATASAAPGGTVPASMGFGLYQGEKLGSAARNAYQRLLQDAFLPRLALRLETLMSTGAANNPEFLYEALKAYLMIHDPAHFDAAGVKAVIGADWDANLPRDVTAEQRRELDAHLEALFERGPVASPLRADTALVASVREQLARTPIAQRIYNRLKRQGVGADIPEFTIAKAGGNSAPLVFLRASGQPLTKGVPGLFTYDGYHKGFVKESERVTRQLADEEGWVLGLPEKDRRFLGDIKARTQVLDGVRRLYLEDYARTWEAFIADIKIVRAANMQQSIQLARLLSASDTPLPLLMRAIVNEVTLVRKDEADKSLIDKASDALTGKKEEAAKLLGRAGVQPSTAAAASTPEAIVDARFESLRRLVRSPGGNAPAPIDQVVPLMGDLYTHLVAVDEAQKKKLPPPAGDAPTKVKAEAARFPEPVRGAVTDLAEVALRGVSQQTRANLNEKLKQIADFCVQAVPGRYPFVRSSPKDVTQEDFGRLFAPGGLLDEFVQRELTPYVDTGSRPWTFAAPASSRAATPAQA